MKKKPQIWHYGLVAQRWAELNCGYRTGIDKRGEQKAYEGKLLSTARH